MTTDEKLQHFYDISIESAQEDAKKLLDTHEAALEKGVKLTGATVHFVTEECDGGPIILQKAVPVLNGDTPESLQKRVMQECEWKILPEAVSLFCQGRIRIIGNKTEII